MRSGSSSSSTSGNSSGSSSGSGRGQGQATGATGGGGGGGQEAGPAADGAARALSSAGVLPVPVILDSGIRRGTDILKALALGATAVLVGRPVLWALAVKGSSGVQELLEMLALEFDKAMVAAGVKAVRDIGPDLVVRAPGCC